MDEAIANPARAGHNRPRNPGVPLAPDWFESVGVNASAVERRAATLTARRSVKKEYQAAWLVKAMTCIDLTTLAGDDTPERVRRLCAKARRPLSEELLAALGLADLKPTVAAVCVYPTMVGPAVKALEGSGIPVASVATGFPAGLTPLKQRLDEIRYAIGEGAREIDIVITRASVLGREWGALYDEVAAMREACGSAHLKAILGTGDLEDVAQRLRGQRGRHAGGRRLHQDLDRQGGRQCHASGESGDDPGAARLPRARGRRHRLQAGGRLAHHEGRARLAHLDERRARPRRGCSPTCSASGRAAS